MQLGLRGASQIFRDTTRADARLGEVLLTELDELKGMAMKVGQILSYMDVGLPAGVTDRLAALQRGVKPLPFDVIAHAIEGELGKPLAELFEHVDPVPIAAASIGQVHRARAPSEPPLAVKVRYPGILGSFEGDFRRLASMGGLARLFTAVDGEALVSELHDRIREECDYHREALLQQQFAAIFHDDGAITVPEVVPSLSSEGVLTTHFHTGVHLDTFCANASAAQRTHAAQALLRFIFKPLLGHCVLHADPHPGNQLYGERGVVALDYGCVRAYDAAFLDAYRQFARAVVAANQPAFQQAATQLGLAPRPERIDFDALWLLYHWMFEPLCHHPFEFTRAWWHRGRAFSSPSAPNQRHLGFPPEWIWLLRAHWGLWAVLVKLGARGDFATPFQSWLAADSEVTSPSHPPSTARHA
jgi:predicted unusual protein kinase regulating ubiquinone biosynthesis (AarF/ABC1/UbiB family)